MLVCWIFCDYIFEDEHSLAKNEAKLRACARNFGSECAYDTAREAASHKGEAKEQEQPRFPHDIVFAAGVCGSIAVTTKVRFVDEVDD